MKTRTDKITAFELMQWSIKIGYAKEAVQNPMHKRACDMAMMGLDALCAMLERQELLNLNTMKKAGESSIEYQVPVWED